MGACATKPGDLKVKGEAPLVVEDAAATLVSCEEKAKADVVVPAAAATAEADPADAGRRRSLSDLLKQEAETSDGEAEKAVTVEPATSAAVEDEAGAKLGAQAPFQAVVETEHDGGAADQPRDDPNGGDVQVVVEEEKRVDPDSVQVAVSAADADSAAPSADETENADAASA